MCNRRQRAVSAGLVDAIAERCMGLDVGVFSGKGLECPGVDSAALRGGADTVWFADMRFEIGNRQKTSGEETW